jgi:hypothetical protein
MKMTNTSRTYSEINFILTVQTSDTKKDNLVDGHKESKAWALLCSSFGYTGKLRVCSRL